MTSWSISRIPGPVAAPLAVLAGGIVGSAVRTAVGIAFPAPHGTFPSATLAVNLLGSLALGFYLARRERAVTSRFSLQFWAIGVLGSLTTFSTFSYEVVLLVEAGSTGTAAWYAVASTVGGLLAAVMGSRVGEVWR
jgi:CrcB protein